MALEIAISEEAYNGLNDTLKAEYVKGESGYKLDVKGLEDTGALKRAKDHESNAHRETKSKLATAETTIADLNLKLADLDKAHATALQTATAEANAKVDKLTGHVRKQMVEDVAFRVASEISTAPKLLAPHIAARLQADFDGDTPATRILGADGKVAEKMTLADLSKEFVENKDFSAIIRASGASGGGAGSRAANNGGAGKTLNSGEGKPNLANLTPKQLAEYMAAKKQ